MAGRPRAPSEIVPPHTIVPMQNRREHFNLVALLPNIIDTDACLRWLAERRLIRNTLACTGCGQPCRLITHAGCIDGKRWYCGNCNIRKSLRDDSFFSRSHLSLQKIIVLIYCWSYDMPQTAIKRETGIDSNHTVVDWCNFLREECETWLVNNPDDIGGMHANGDPVVVEIDESKYFHRKYHRGQWRDGHWVFGGIERETGKCFLLEVPDRSSATLLPIIRRHILPGSHIISDGWPSYANIDQIAGGIYMHSVIVHQRHFVDPNDPDVHTEHVENMWMRAKRKLRRQFGTSRALFPSYLHEFVFRNKFRNEDMFLTMMKTIADNYPL